MSSTSRHRHGCLTTLLILLAISSIVTSTLLVLFSEVLKNLSGNLTNRLIILQICATLLELVGIFYVFKWKKIGFYGIAISYMFDLYIMDKLGQSDINTLLGIAIRLGILYAVLQIKSRGVSGWDNLTE